MFFEYSDKELLELLLYRTKSQENKGIIKELILRLFPKILIKANRYINKKENKIQSVCRVLIDSDGSGWKALKSKFFHNENYIIIGLEILHEYGMWPKLEDGYEKYKYEEDTYLFISKFIKSSKYYKNRLFFEINQVDSQDKL